MANVGIVLISHSSKVVAGIQEIIQQVVHNVPIEIAGGTEDDEIGTSVEKINNAIERAYSEKGVLLFYDLGSAKMNAELAIELCGYDHVKVINAPILEGAYVAAVESGIGRTIEEIEEAVQKITKE
ncbi:dihydroxyacetone kinase phosphoryl donor subunit DhaM [Robertmurraya sp. DFI.2.37]|jgi:dihydroxyacetone kinase phosphotransfer subunit|uniref:dihydroxyacetone kinase phosphoryl donor subunit DhaM n=1 Tax=Robertmurraya TaxID=2837507 RepID=UPI000BA6F603|nr:MULTISPECIES: dihydroxyacetone kinase phosphoryl donor subunit DhaM [Robertmurraya]MDF1508812.1 dihydroxyacetone kinase phosphoryl donor subunit DhaM [Robertmurraya sp. DFI.2.37]PAE21045.1 PTS mannose transporter subunit IID [Bacillus sp. 7504-2]